ncbi:MAG: hypothetical protein HOO88_04315 [Kiritimatiellaceae bacterium]|nr:hypothetical protein [Kiritimatiellaceae bacterium]
MRKVMAGITALLLIQSAPAETIITAQDYAVDSDVVLESAVREIKSAPRDTVNVVGDTVKFVSDETITAVNGVKAVFKSNPIDKTEKTAALEIASAWDSSNDIVFRSYKVSDKVGKELTGGAEAAPGTVVDVSGFFSGIEFKKGTSAFFRPEFNRLFVRQTLGNVLSMEDVLAEQSSAVRELMGKQVQIETKFVEVNQSTLNELGFKWTFDNFKGGDLHIMDAISIPAGQPLLSSGLRTTAGAIGSGVASDTLTFVRDGRLDWTLVVNALEQSDDTDVLSAPSITTRDGNKATIMVGEDRVIAKGYDVKSSDSSLYVQNDLEKMLMGVQLEVTPKIRADKLIDLDLKPKVVDLVGYDPYQSTPTDAKIIPVQGAGVSGSVASGSTIGSWLPLSWFPSGFVDSPIQIPLLPLTAKIPYYRLREINTQVTVADGSTVAMGGLIFDKLETFKDKVPVLGSIPLIGRLFRSEGEKSVKRNLMIFVTATQVDVNGRKASDLALNK